MMIQSRCTKQKYERSRVPKAAQHGIATNSQQNLSLRLLLAQAEINAQILQATAAIDTREREAADKLQKLILEELRPPYQESLATVGAISLAGASETCPKPSTRSTPSRPAPRARTRARFAFPGTIGAAQTLARSSAALPENSDDPERAEIIDYGA